MGADPRQEIPDKQMLYGKFQAQEDLDNGYHNEQREWGSTLKKKLIHKSLDIPISPESGEDMQVDARKTTTNSGLDWRHLAVIAIGGLGTLGIFKFAPDKSQPYIVQQPTPLSVSSPIKQDYTTQIEIRDKLTGKPIKVDWINGDSQSAPTPKPAGLPGRFLDPTDFPSK